MLLPCEGKADTGKRSQTPKVVSDIVQPEISDPLTPIINNQNLSLIRRIYSVKSRLMLTREVKCLRQSPIAISPPSVIL